MPLPRTFLLTACAGLAACSAPLVPQGRAVTLQTDSVAYTTRYASGEGLLKQYGFIIVARLDNPTDSTVYLERCWPTDVYPSSGLRLIEPTDGKWGAYGISGNACIGHDAPLIVRPGESRVDSLRVQGPGAVDFSTGEISGRLSGRFRLIYYVRPCIGDSCHPRSTELQSNILMVRLSQ